jgi:hypothetical protein
MGSRLIDLVSFLGEFMATFNLVINYPDGEGPRILAALKTRYDVLTNAAAIEAFRKDMVLHLRAIVLQEEQIVARAAIVPITPT